MRAFATVLALALLIGCVGDAPTPPPPGPQVATSTAAPIPEASAPEPPAPTIVSASVPVDWSGKIPASACAGVGPCQGLVLSIQYEDTKEFDATNATSAALRLTWDPATPQAEDLNLSLGGVTHECDACTTFWLAASVEGPPPLSLDLTSVAPVPGKVAIWVRGVEKCQENGEARACAWAADQPFLVEGTIVTTQA